MIRPTFNIQSGFNLVELLIVVAIMGIIMAFAAPSYNNFLKNQAIAATSNEIIATLQAARSEAIKRGLTVNACFKNQENGPLCQDPGVTSNEVRFVYAFIDTDNDNRWDANEETLFRSNELDHNIIFKQNAADGRNLGGSIRFDSRGQAFFQAGGLRKTAYLAICDDRKNNQDGRLITISKTGRATISNIPATNSYVNCS